MPLDRHVKRFLAMAAAAGMTGVSEHTPAQMREAFLGLGRLVDAKDIPIGQVENRQIAGPAGPVALRIYTPVGVEYDHGPGLIYFHGGAWVFGNLDTHEGLCRMLANESGCRVISVEYRLAPEHKFPAAVQDSYAATQWVAQNAPQLRINPSQIAVGGDSAGGNLAAVVCQLARQNNGPELALQVLLCPVMDMGAVTDSRRAFAAGYFLDQETLDWALKHNGLSASDLHNPQVSPLRAMDVSGLPPAHIHTAEFDPVRDEGRAYADRLEQAGVEVHYTCHQGMIHHFYGMAGIIPYARTAIKTAGAAIRQALGTGRELEQSLRHY